MLLSLYDPCAQPDPHLPIPTLVVHHIQVAPHHGRPRSFGLDLFLGPLDLGLLVPFGDPDGYRLAFEVARGNVDQGHDPGFGESR